MVRMAQAVGRTKELLCDVGKEVQKVRIVDLQGQSGHQERLVNVAGDSKKQPQGTFQEFTRLDATKREFLRYQSTEALSWFKEIDVVGVEGPVRSLSNLLTGMLSCLKMC